MENVLHTIYVLANKILPIWKCEYLHYQQTTNVCTRVTFTPASGTFGCMAATIPTIGNQEFNMCLTILDFVLEMKIISLMKSSSLAVHMTISICCLTKTQLFTLWTRYVTYNVTLVIPDQKMSDQTIFCSVRSSRSHFVCLSVRPAQSSIKVSQSPSLFLRSFSGLYQVSLRILSSLRNKGRAWNTLSCWDKIWVRNS